jgi:cytochrome oxidase Cu insertion factor (SCO1/SenC/PrrC family)
VLKLLMLAAVSLAIALPAKASAALVDQRGVPFALAGQRGPVVMTFIATRCTDACPVANAVFAGALVGIEKVQVPATFVTVTLDPGYDTPFVMAEYARRVGADPRHWRFVSGSPRDVGALMRRFGVVGNAAAHSSLIYVVRDGLTVRSFLLSSDASNRIVEFLKKA